MSKSIEERISDLQEKQAQLKARERALRARVSQRERRMRTKRLIETGAIVEKALGIEIDTQERRQALVESLLKERGDESRGGAVYTRAEEISDDIRRMSSNMS